MIKKKPWWKYISPIINLPSASLAGVMSSATEVSQHNIKHGNNHAAILNEKYEYGPALSSQVFGLKFFISSVVYNRQLPLPALKSS